MSQLNDRRLIESGGYSAPSDCATRIPVTAERNKVRVLPLDFPVKAALGYVSLVFSYDDAFSRHHRQFDTLVHLHSSDSLQQGVSLHFVRPPLLQDGATYCDAVLQQKSPENTMKEKLKKTVQL